MKSHRLTTKRPSRKQRPTGEATAPHIERADAPVQSLETLRNPHADAAGRGRAALGLQRVVGNAAIGHLVSNVAVQMMPKSHVDVVDIYREQPAVSQAEAAVNTNVDSRERRLAERITELARNGGITVSVYIDPVKISGKPVKGAAEFERQASQFADDHGAIGLSANGLQIGAAMQLSQSLPSLLQSLNVRLEELLAHHRDLGGLQ